MPVSIKRGYSRTIHLIPDSRLSAHQMHTPRKRFGQNFLIDDGIIHAIVNAIHPQAGETVVEIGPGLGALTRPLLERLPHLHAVELDRDIVARLQRTWPAERLTVHSCDALKFDFGAAGPRPAHHRQPAVQHFHAAAVPPDGVCRAHPRHDLHAAEGSRRTHGRRAVDQRLRTAVDHAAAPLPPGMAARRAAHRLQPAAQGRFRGRPADSQNPGRNRRRSTKRCLRAWSLPRFRNAARRCETRWAA